MLRKWKRSTSIVALLFSVLFTAGAVEAAPGPSGTGIGPVVKQIAENSYTIDDKVTITGVNNGKKLELHFSYQNITSGFTGAQIGLPSETGLHNGQFMVSTDNEGLNEADVQVNEEVESVYTVLIGSQRLVESPAGVSGELGVLAYDADEAREQTVTLQSLIINQKNIHEPQAMDATNVTLTFTLSQDYIVQQAEQAMQAYESFQTGTIEKIAEAEALEMPVLEWLARIKDEGKRQELRNRSDLRKQELAAERAKIESNPYVTLFLGGNGGDKELKKSIYTALNANEVNQVFKGVTITVKQSPNDAGITYQGAEFWLTQAGPGIIVKFDKIHQRVVAQLNMDKLGNEYYSIELGGPGFVSQTLSRASFEAPHVLIPGNLDLRQSGSNAGLNNLDFWAWFTIYKKSLLGAATTGDIQLADLTRDGKVNILDYKLWLEAYRLTR